MTFLPDLLSPLAFALTPLVTLLAEVLVYWQAKFFSWWSYKPIPAILQGTLNDSQVFEEWEAAAFQLDEVNGNDLWRQNPTSKYYDYRLIYERLQLLIEAREDDDILSLVSLLRSGLVRNLGNITTPRLFNRAYAGTKLLIEDYITQLALAVDYVAGYPVGNDGEGLTGQAKLDLLHDTRQAFGRSALVLQGGAIFGLCHIGVIKALHLRGLLPRIIVGTATGALIAALVGVHTESELLDSLAPEKIDLNAFATKRKGSARRLSITAQSAAWWETLVRRVKRFVKEGYFLDGGMLEECVRANVGDLTFEEAYARTKRVLNITIPTDGRGDIPSLLNYLTAPNVVIWSAAVASNASSSGPFFFSRSGLLCKDENGTIRPWRSSKEVLEHANPAHLNGDADGLHTPLTRVSELFNVNHFVVSQARPYIAPFLQTGDVLSRVVPSQNTTRQKGMIWQPLLRILVLEVQHRLKQLDALGFLHPSIRRFVIDDVIPGASLTLVPELSAADFLRLLERPTARVVNDWIRRGEKSAWPAISALRVRCAVEVELDRAYQVVRRRKPLDAFAAAAAAATAAGPTGSSPEDDVLLRAEKKALQRSRDAHSPAGSLKGPGEKRKRKRLRSSSFAGTPELCLWYHNYERRTADDDDDDDDAATTATAGDEARS